MFSVFGMQTELNEDIFNNYMKQELFKVSMQKKVASYVNSALDLECWQPAGSKKISDIVNLKKYSSEQQESANLGKIIFVDSQNNSNFDASNTDNLYIKISFSEGGTCVKKNLLTFVLTDLFTVESVNGLNAGNLETISSLIQKESQKTGLFKNSDTTENNSLFAKKYDKYDVVFVIAHELIHFMQNKMGDFDKLTIFSKPPVEKTIFENLDFLKKYKSSFVRFLSDVDINLTALEIKKLSMESYNFKESDNTEITNLISQIVTKTGTENNSINHIINNMANPCIVKIQQMDEKLIEESAILGMQWADTINEWRILYKNKIPVRYPYSQQESEVFTLEGKVAQRMFESVFSTSDFLQYPFQSSLQQETKNKDKLKKVEVSNTSKEMSNAQKISMFNMLIKSEKRNKFNKEKSNEEIAEIIGQKYANDEVKLSCYNAWKLDNEKE
jgi:hypothetical protein